MKKKPRSLIRKFVLYLFAALFFITTIIFLVFGVKGSKPFTCFPLCGENRIVPCQSNNHSPNTFSL